MIHFDFFEHTADIGIRGYGKTYLEALEGVAKAMFTQICDVSEMSNTQEHRLEISADTPEDLVIRFLNKLILLLETEHFVPIHYELSQPNPKTIHAVLQGDTLDSAKHEVRAEVKAATYHNLEIEHNGDWMIQVIVDV
jgi:SHS2 domain-containing protein